MTSRSELPASPESQTSPVTATPALVPDGARSSRRSTPLLVLEAMRPKHWIKNAFVLGGLVFSGEIMSLDKEVAAWSMVVSFCLIRGATYLVNDVADAEADRANPRTASRPIARGDLSARTAVVWAVLAALIALALAATVNWESLVTLAGFGLLQVAYSVFLKHLLFIDVMAVAAGFVLRAFAGLVAIEGVPISDWLLLCTGLLALFLALGKRRSEAVALGGASTPQRPVLDQYSVRLIDEMISVVTPSILVSYALYSVLGARTSLMLLTLPFIVYGIFRVLYLIHHQSTLSGDPAMVLYRDRAMLVCVSLWIIAAGVISVASA